MTKNLRKVFSSSQTFSLLRIRLDVLGGITDLIFETLTVKKLMKTRFLVLKIYCISTKYITHEKPYLGFVAL